MSRVSSILEKKGPLLSGELTSELVKNFLLSPEAARKQISRATEPVRKLKNVTFENNQKFLYLDAHFARNSFLDNLIEKLKSDSKAYYYFVKAIINSYGFIRLNDIPTYSCSPIKPLIGHKLAELIIKDLLLIKVLVDNGDGLLSLNQSVSFPQNYTRYKALDLAKKIVINDFYDWARKINLVSYNSGKLLNQTPEFHKFQWSFTAPSYIHGLHRGSSPGFLVCDVIIGKKVLEEDIEYFLSKVNVINQSKKHSPFIPVLLIEGIEEKAFLKLKSAGVLLGFIDKLFGSEYLDVLRSLVGILENASAVISKNPDKYFELMEAFAKLEGKASNLRGDVFELAVGCYYSQISSYIEINKLVTDYKSSKSKEIDVYVKYPNEVRFVECKGYKYPLDKEYVSKWLTDNIPTIRNWALSQDECTHKKHVFELWSTGGFEDSARDLLENYSKSTNKYEIKFFGKNEILKIAKDSKNNNLKRILQNYFSDDFKQ